MQEYKLLIVFLVKFFITYFVLTLGYDFYLKETQVTEGEEMITDPYTKEVAEEASCVYNIMYGGNSYVVQNMKSPFMDFYIGKKRIAYINEGCNAISVMITMVSFIIAFGTKFFVTFFYTLFSVGLVHLVNIVRISMLSHILFLYKEYSKLAHDALFPGIIYGAIILICVVWIKFFVLKKKKKNE